MTIGGLKKTVSWGGVVKLWVVCWIGNLIGSVVSAAIFTMTGIPGSGDIGAFFANAAAGKMGYEPVTIFILAPGAFFVLAFLSALQNKFKIGAAKRGIDPSNPDCKGGCASCGNSMCSGKRG